MRSSDQSPSSLTLLTVIGLALFLSAVIFFILDVLYWLRYASWSATKLSDVFRYYGIAEPYFVEWRGLQELWGYLRDAPLSLLLLGSGSCSHAWLAAFSGLSAKTTAG